MRKFLYILGALTLTMFVVIGVGVGVLAYNGTALDAESKTFVDGAVPAITANWSEDQLLDRSTPELRDSIKPGELKSLFTAFARIGPLVEYQGAMGEANMSYVAGVGSTVSASYVAKARFQNGDATFRIVLLKRGGHWLIQNFHVDTQPNGRAAERA